MRIPLSYNDYLFVETNSIFFDVDKKTILFLYQPIMSKNASLLYFFLLEISNSHVDNEIMHTSILEGLRLSLDEFIIARKSLESFSLIKTYYNAESKKYRIVIFPPLTPSTFFKKKALFLKWQSAVSKSTNEVYTKILGTVKNSKNKGIDISANIDEYLFLNKEIKEVEKVEYKNRRKIKSMIINYDWLFKNNDNKQIVCSQKILDEIEALRFVFGINSAIIKKIVEKSIVKNIVDWKIFSKEVREILKKWNKYLPNLNIDTEISKEKTDEFKKAKEIMNRLTVFEYYIFIYGDEPNKALLRELLKIMRTHELTSELMNCLLDFSFIKNKKLSINYIKKIAETIQKNNLYSLDDLMIHLINSMNIRKEKISLDDIDVDNTNISDLLKK